MKVIEAIKRVVEEIDKYPFIYRNETDVQARLYCALCKILDDWKPKYKTSFKNQMMNRVHCEYYGGKKKSIDVVVLDEKDINEVTKRGMKKRDNKPIKIAHAIEIKVEQGKSGDQKLRNYPIEDIEKLRNYKQDGRADQLHFIYIVRWVTKNIEKQNMVKNIMEEVREKCKDDINFYTNDVSNYFLEEH